MLKFKYAIYIILNKLASSHPKLKNCMLLYDTLSVVLGDLRWKPETTKDRTVIGEEHPIEVLAEQMALQLNSHFGNALLENALYSIAGFIVQQIWEYCLVKTASRICC